MSASLNINQNTIYHSELKQFRPMFESNPVVKNSYYKLCVGNKCKIKLDESNKSLKAIDLLTKEKILEIENIKSTKIDDLCIYYCATPTCLDEDNKLNFCIKSFVTSNIDKIKNKTLDQGYLFKIENHGGPSLPDANIMGYVYDRYQGVTFGILKRDIYNKSHNKGITGRLVRHLTQPDVLGKEINKKMSMRKIARYKRLLYKYRK